MPTNDKQNIENLKKQRWFNSIDFGDFEVIGREGEYFKYPNISLYSSMYLLNTIDFRGMRCLEIGPGSGLISIGLAKLGADYVAAVDGHDVPTCRAAIEVSGQKVDYFTFGLEGIKNRSRWINSFDFVFSAGLMYHLINPFLLVEIAKMVLKEKGLFLLQSMIVKNDNRAGMYLNTRININGDKTTFFVPSVEAMRGLMNLGLFSRLGECICQQEPGFYAILGQSVTRTSDLNNLKSHEAKYLGFFQDQPNYPYGGYDYAAFTRKTLESGINSVLEKQVNTEFYTLDLNEQEPPIFPYQPRPRSIST
ncbi:bifunctional 2-polyprenyl-6-hydroxyphenol methylase/3-demethylubiquinol 3-O-methyltransferase UbiG [Lyngbya sp. PCC 8106]|uniref:class I SAM-dependent methyltransferase n=1 Tax=Lyngbya sp. (strain PCC 8106) TaxID=313612 RepID=UPI0000EABC6C|nr:DUF1698 domain-containing protein [Lyngbya sp. PCC 8106]EAW35605.1 hypothetical protein L8106_13380 [Lyngbya sp. PCC 8106]